MPGAGTARRAGGCSSHSVEQGAGPGKGLVRFYGTFFPGKYHRGLEQEGDTLCATAAPSVQSKSLNLRMRSCREEGAGMVGRQGEGQVSGAAPARWNC